MSNEPEGLILQLLSDMRPDMGELRDETVSIRADMATWKDIDELRSEARSLRADGASDLLLARNKTRGQIAGPRRGVMEHDTPVIGHGILTSNLGARVRPVEPHLYLPAMNAH